MKLRRLAGLGTMPAVLAMVACGPAGATVENEVSVFAASSMSDALRDVVEAFEAEHPAGRVTLTFAGSQILRLQIEQGARADVFISADESHVAALGRAGLLRAESELATNGLTVVTSADASGSIQTFADLARVERIAVGTRAVPIGRYTDTLLARVETDDPALARAIRGAVVTREANVRLVRAKVALGEADAAVVYRTDANAAEVRAVPIPARYAVAAEYRLALIGEDPSPLAEELARYLLGERGQSILAQHGFEPAGGG